MTGPAQTETTPRDLAPAEERGRLTIAGAVVAGIVEAAASEVDGVISDPRLGVGRANRAARATVRLDGNVAAVRVRVALHYPQPIAEVVTRLRTHILSRVEELARVTVQTCDIDVTALVARPHDGKVG
jgi:uncharacterized alkaline shock family protein YloU